MTTSVEKAEFVPARTLPNGQSYWSKFGLFDFQADDTAEAYLRTEPGMQSGVIAVWDTGIGKTHLGMALAAMLVEDDKIDLVMVIAEKNKITDWRDDFEKHTTLHAHRYHGTGRQKRLAKAGTPHVFVTTYETGRNELRATEKVKGHRALHEVDGELMTTLGLRDKRVLWIFDEATKLRGRSSQLHHAYAYVLRELRKGPHHQRVVGLTGTPMERDWEDAFNVGRLICPERMPTVTKFESTFVRGIDDLTGRYLFDRDKMPAFSALFQGIILRKRKTDQDVIDQFPKQIEETAKVSPHPLHADLYATLEGLFDVPEGEDDPRSPAQRVSDERRLWNILRMTAGHPASHLHASNEVSLTIAATVGEDVLRSVPSSKTVELISRLKPIVKGQGSQAIVFTFYGNTVLKELVADLRKAGFSTVSYHGGNSLKRNDDAKRDFKAGRAEILVTSDAGSRGISLQNAEYVFEYESACTFANRVQRINRVHRIDSDHPLVTAVTMVLEGTIEEGIIDKVLQRNEDQDMLLGDTDDGSAFVSAQARRELLGIARGRRRRSTPSGS